MLYSPCTQSAQMEMNNEFASGVAEVFFRAEGIPGIAFSAGRVQKPIPDNHQLPRHDKALFDTGCEAASGRNPGVKTSASSFLAFGWLLDLSCIIHEIVQPLGNLAL
jgi:hypothetical protein